MILYLDRKLNFCCYKTNNTLVYLQSVNTYILNTMYHQVLIRFVLNFLTNLQSKLTFQVYKYGYMSSF